MWLVGVLAVFPFIASIDGALLGSCPGSCSPQCYPACNPMCCYTAQQSSIFQQQRLQQQQQQKQQQQLQYYYQQHAQQLAPPPASYIQVPATPAPAPAFSLTPSPSPAPAPSPSTPPPPCASYCPKECYPQCSTSCCEPKPPPMPLYMKRKQQVAVACEGHKLKIKCPNKYDRIALYSTFYGRDENKTCQHKVLPSKGHCVAEEHRVNKKLFDLCQGENKCSVAATNAFLGKKNNVICPEVYKYARVVYRCIQHPKIVPVCSLPCHKPSKCFPRCDISCCTPPPPPPPPPAPILPPTCPGACPAQCFPACSQACCSPPPPPPPAPVYYPMPPPALPPPPTCPGSCPSACAPVCSVRCCISRSAEQNSMSPLSYSAPRVAPAAYRYGNYYPAAQSNNYNQYRQYAQAKSPYLNPYARYQAYRTSYGDQRNLQNVNRYQG